NVQWMMLIGISFVVSAFLQVVRGYNAIQTGVIFTATTVGLLVSSLGAERFARRREQRSLIVAGFVTTVIGVAVLLALVPASPSGRPRGRSTRPARCPGGSRPPEAG